MSMLEAMSVGLIPFVQPNSSFKDLIRQGGVGECVDYAHPDTAANQIATAIQSVQDEDRKSARDFSKLFSWEELAAKNIETYMKS